MRIALSNSSPKWGGLHVVTEVLARGLQTHGHDVIMFGYPGSPLEARLKNVAPFEGIGPGMDLSPLALRRATMALRRHRIQIVLAMTKKDVRHTVPAAWMLGIPSVVRYPNDRPLKGGIYDRLFFGMLPAAHITNSYATRQTLLKSAPWLARRPVKVIHNGIDSRSFEFAEKADLGLPPDSLVVGFLGRLERRKGLIDLATAWKSVAPNLPNAHLVIAGSGPDEAEAKAILGNTPQVHWLGFRKDVPSLLKAFDITVVPSHWEGFGLVAAEALLAGSAVIAANASSLPEIVTDGVHGRLVPPHNPASLGEAIVRLAGEPEERSRLADAGRMRVLDEFSATAMVDRFEETLRGVVDER